MDVSSLQTVILFFRLAPSKDIFKRWYYDSSDGTCKDFDFKGKKGNGNRFLTRQECQASCQPSQVHLLTKLKKSARWRFAFRMFARCPKFKAHVMIKLKCIGTTKAKMNVSLLIGVSKDEMKQEICIMVHFGNQLV